MWAGRFAKSLDSKADDFNSSIRFDCKMYKQDILGSIAHAKMLEKQSIICTEDCKKIIDGLTEILEDINGGKLDFDMSCEDIHMFVEAELTRRIGDAGKRLHTARSRNDQVALDIRMYLRDRSEDIIALLRELIDAICEKAEEGKAAIVPGYTHLQRAQPITFGHHIMAYAQMFLRDISRIEDAVARMNYSPIGSCALAGTTYNTDRFFEAEQLGFDGITQNSIDGVSDRDFCVELMSAFSLIMMHLSRFSEEIILWSSWEFKFVELDDAYTTGSSIMPQKKNSDMAELVRGKTGRVYGDLFALLTTLKGIPLAYNKDMQEDKEMAFDAMENVQNCLILFNGMIETMKFRKDKMAKSALGGFTNATDAADYLVNKGVPFRDAHGIIGRLVLYCIEKNCAIDDLTLDELKTISDVFEQDIYDAISLETCVEKRLTIGAPGMEAMRNVIAINKEYMTNFTDLGVK